MDGGRVALIPPSILFGGKDRITMNIEQSINEHIVQKYQIHNAKTGKGYTIQIQRKEVQAQQYY